MNTALLSEPYGMLIGLGIAIFFLFYMSKGIEQKHPILSLICIVFSVVLLNLVPITVMDSNGDCAYWVSQSNLTAGTVNSTMSVECFEGTSQAPDSFYSTILTFQRIFYTYSILYILWFVVQAVMRKFKLSI
jgi:hypothetical protein